MKLLVALFVTSLSFCFGQAQSQPKQPPKGKVVVQDLQTGQHYEIKAPPDTLQVRQTGPTSYDVKVNPGQTQKIEVKPVPPPNK